MSAPAVRLHRRSPPALASVAVVLVAPSHPGNVGAAARAMRVMGLRDLRLVAPRVPDAHHDERARAFASGATDVLAQAKVFGSLPAALADVTLAIAVSAEVREFGPAPVTPETAAAEALARAAAGGRAAFVFGAERTGLSIADVARCQRLCSIAGDPDYNSLNLAQAVQVVTYVLRRSCAPDDASPAASRPLDAAAVPGASGVPATVAELEGFYAHLEQALLAIGYLDPRAPKKLMPRMRRLFARAGPEREEINLLRGLCATMLAQATRARSEQGAAPPRHAGADDVPPPSAD